MGAAETLVLARLTIDSDGVVRGMASVGTAFDDGEQKIRRHAKNIEGLSDKLAERFLSLRHIAAAMLGGFTVAEAVMGIGALTRQVIENTAAFKEAKEGVPGWWTELTTGKSGRGQMIESLYKQ